MREIYEITLPISGEEADTAGMPAEYFERAVRRLGKMVRLEGVVIDQASDPRWQTGHILPSTT